MDWKILSSEYINRHQYFTARKDACSTASGKIVEAYFVVELPAAACAMALTENNEIILIKQYRHPIQQTILELPGGFIDDQEDPVNGIQRELLEETGYAFSKVELLGKVAANPGVLDNFTYLFLATGGKKVAPQKLDDNEEIVIELLSPEKVRSLLDENKITQGVHTCCLFYGFAQLDFSKK